MTSLSPPADEASADSAPDTLDRLRTLLAETEAAAACEWHIAADCFVGDLVFAGHYGLSPAEALAGIGSAAFFAIVHPGDRNRMRLALGGVARGADSLSKEFRIIPAGGATVRWIHLRGQTHWGEDGRPVRFGAVLIDITEQKRLQEQLRVAQTAGGVGTFEYVIGFGTAAVSAKFCSLLGLHPAADLPLRTINAVVYPGDPPIIDPAARPPASSTTENEFRVLLPRSAEPRWLMRRGEYLGDGETPGMRFSGVIYDITAAKRNEVQLRTLNDSLEHRVAERTRERDRVWNLSDDLLGVADKDGVWLSVNPAWHRLLGWTAAEVVGQPVDWPAEASSGPVAQALQLLAEGARTSGLETRLLGRSGAEHVLSWAVVREGDRFYCAGSDVTAARQAADALAKAEEQLRQSQKMEAVGQLTGGLAHDFNNMLAVITGSLELMQTSMRQGNAAKFDRFAGAAMAAANRAAALTHRLLAFARRQTLAPKLVMPNDLVLGMDLMLRRAIGPAVTIATELAGDLGAVRCDPNQLENAVLNLAINARDAMPEGGVVTVRTANQDLDAPDAAARGMAAGRYVTLSVTDTGTGMSADTMARAFDPFFTTKPQGQGTGLGLSMIYGFAKQSDGEAVIESAEGAGTTVTLYFPRAEATQASVPEPGWAAARTPASALRGKTILLVDDEPDLRLVLAGTIAHLGYATIEAADGPAALRHLAAAGTIDLLVTDVGLPGGMNGRQLAREARMLRPGLRVLFITGYAEPGVLRDTDLQDGAAVLAKPFEMEALAAKVREMVGA